jgi:hypothetical protein
VISTPEFVVEKSYSTLRGMGVDVCLHVLIPLRDLENGGAAVVLIAWSSIRSSRCAAAHFFVVPLWS